MNMVGASDAMTIGDCIVKHWDSLPDNTDVAKLLPILEILAEAGHKGCKSIFEHYRRMAGHQTGTTQ